MSNEKVVKAPKAPKAPAVDKTLMSDVRTAVAGSRRMSAARDALAVYAVIVAGIAQTTLATETGIDKSDLSKKVKLANETPATLAAIKSLVRSGTPTARLDAAAAVGALLVRKRATPAKVGTPATPKGETAKVAAAAAAKVAASDESRDLTAELYEWLLLSDNRATFDNRSAAIRDMIANANKAFRAAAAAAAEKVAA